MYGQPACGVKRSVLNLALKLELAEASIELHEGWKLQEIIEKEESVVAIAADGKEVEGSFLIGCDGIKSVTRSLVLAQHDIGEGDASYTGLTQASCYWNTRNKHLLTRIQEGGMSLTPASLMSNPSKLDIYGPNAHFICYPVSPTTMSWAITQKSNTETQETWRNFTPKETVAQRDILLEQFRNWGSPVPELIAGAEGIIKYGLYDRPQLEPRQWYSLRGRCVLIGDAAHPTSPHLGQGANQAL